MNIEDWRIPRSPQLIEDLTANPLSDEPASVSAPVDDAPTIECLTLPAVQTDEPLGTLDALDSPLGGSGRLETKPAKPPAR